MVVRNSVLLVQRAGNAQIRMELEMLNVCRYVCRFATLCSRVEVIFVKLFTVNFCVNKPMTSLVIIKMMIMMMVVVVVVMVMVMVMMMMMMMSSTEVIQLTDYGTGCRNVSHCQQQQSYSGLRSPGRSNSTYFWLW